MGADIATSLAHGSPAMIILIGRSFARTETVIRAISEVNSSVRVKWMETDLASLASVRRTAEMILNDEDIAKIDVIINNAAVMACPHTLTEDGIELQLATSHTSHFVLTNMIMPKVLAAGPWSRLVLTTSSAHRASPVNLDDPNFTKEGTYAEFDAYGSAKSAVLLYAVALNRRLGPRGVRAVAPTPGRVETHLQDHVKSLGRERLTGMYEKAALKVYGKSMGEVAQEEPRKTLEQGSSTTLYAALDPDLASQDGVYVNHCQLRTDPNEVKDWATDPELAERCWKMSEALVGQTFNF